MKTTQKLLWEYFYYHVDGYFVWRKTTGNRNINRIGMRAGCLDPSGYRHIKFFNKHHKEHRLIFLYFHNYLPKEIDHIDRNKSNNKIENLRSVSRAQNLHNRTRQKGKNSKYQGVCWHKQHQKWQVSIMKKGKAYHLGLYDDEKEAARVWNLAALLRDPKHYNPNIIED